MRKGPSVKCVRSLWGDRGGVGGHPKSTYLVLSIDAWWAVYQGGGRGRGGDGDTDEQPLSDKPPLIRCAETCGTWQ